MSQLGRISGQLLKENLTRNGHDLAFETDLLYLDVTNRRIGIKNVAPTTELDVTGTTRTTNLEVTNQSDLGDITVLGNTITSNTGILNLTNGAGNQVTYQTQLEVDDITITSNVISTNNGSVNLELRPHGSGTVDIYANTNVYGNITVTGNISTDGTITVGDDNTDNITINADIASNIIPDADVTYTLGNGGTGYIAGTDFTLGDVELTVSGSGTTVTLSIPASGPGWVNALIAHTVGKSYQLALFGTPGIYSVNTLGAWTGTNPKTVTTTNNGLLDGTYNVSLIRFDQKRWLDLWVQNIYADNIVSGGITVGGIDLTSVQGKIYYVSANGSDTNAGQHQNDPFATVKYALSVATSEDTVYIYPGTYAEIFPLTVPVGVAVKGSGIRSVKIVPTNATRYNDAFLLNGETTVEDITIADFFSGGNYFAVTTAGIGETVMNVGTAPFAHTWVSGGTINISGTDYSIISAVYSHTTGVLTVNHVGPNATGASPVFLSGLIFSCNGGNRTFPDNGYAFRFATDFAVTSRSPYVRNITVLTKGSTISGSDPLGYDAGNAGKGAYIDGAYATAVSKEASMLFHSVTFICPGVDVIVATNGARVEWLNSFTYYANRSMYLYSSADGFAGNGKTRIKIPTRTGTWAVGNTLSYYDTNGSTVLASGVIESIDGDFYNIDTRVLGFEKIQDRAGKTITVHGDAKLATAVKKFGTASLALDGTGDYLSVASQPDFAFPSTISRLAKTITAAGNAAVSATQSKFGGSSIAFDGTGDYLSLATSTDYGFGTGDFTIEGWIYKTTTTTQYLFDTRTTLTENSVAVQSNGSGSLRLFVNGAFVLTSSNAHTNNAWNHLAISRASGVTRFFINGVVSTTTYTDTTNYGTTKPLVVGAQYNGTTAFAGYIDDFRVSNTARYTATFTPSTTAFVNDVNTKLLIHGDSTIVDDAGGGTATDFTIESWIYPTAGSAYQTIFDFRTAAIQQSIYLAINTSNQLYLYVNGVITITTAATVSLSTWTHVALVRSNASTKIYINGTQSGSSWADITDYGTTKPLRIGADYSGASGFTGYIDDVRITKGVARYTATFSVPTAQLTGDLSTVLLITLNGTNNSTAIADNGITLQDLRTSAGGTASIIDFADYSDFGVEVRSIGSAAVYGNYGIYGDGPGVIAYLIGQNLAYIGNGKATTNDPVTVIQVNEVVELNDAKIFYNSVDHQGDFRIGDLFYVNQQTGEVSFTNSNVTIGTSLTFDNGLGDVTFLDATKIETGDFRISGNTVETLTQDFNIQAASNLINLESNVTITGNLDVTGNVTIGGNITIGDQSTDTVSFVAGVNSDIVPNNPLSVPVYNLGTLAKQWLNLYSAQLTIGNVQIDTNVVRTTLTNANLSLQANGSGRIYVPSNNVELGQNLTVNGTTYLKDTTIVGTVTHTGAVTQTGDVTQIGNVGITGTLTVSSYAQFQDIKVDTNQITTTIGNNNLELAAHGTGKIYVPSNDVQIDQNLTVNGTIYTNALQVTQPLEANKFTTGDITIEDNIITTTIGNNNLELRAAGTGLIEFEQFQVQENELKMSTSADMVLTPNGTGIVNINSTQSIKVPVGTTGERPGTPVAGMIRFNTSLTRYEGYDGTNWVRLDGVADVDNNTYITAELTPGANDNTFRFVTNSVQVADLNSTRLNVINVDVDNINLNDNIISTNVTNTDLLVQTTGTGSVKIGNLAFKNNSITNYVSNSITVLNQTGDSYFKVAGTYGLVIPSGETLERPVTVERGMMRFNTTDQRVEIFDGTDWVSAAGSSSGITLVEATDLAIVMAHIFG